MKPHIGIPTERQTIDGSLYSATPFRYTEALELAGAVPVLIPLTLRSESLRAIYARLDGLLLAGGVDVNPQEYGEMTQPFCGSIDLERDRVELELTRLALGQGLPIFGICRGVQTLNVAAGGSLYQDIASQIPASLPHSRRPCDPRNRRVHSIEIRPGSLLARALGATRVEVNSSHHQAVKQVAPGFRVVARAPDGVIEGLESENHRFVLGVQFHPEWLVDDEGMLRLFQEFARCASVY